MRWCRKTSSRPGATLPPGLPTTTPNGLGTATSSRADTERRCGISSGCAKTWTKAAAVALMREATALEDAMPVEFGPPADVKPAHELFGEILLQAGRPREAQREFARALQLAPKRALSLRGLGRAAAAAGDATTAARAYAELRAIWHRADADRPELAEAARFLAARP